MADLNGGKGKFYGVDSNVKYEDSFKGATKVAEKVKKGGTASKSDGYVVDAIDIDWGGLKLTTIDNGWSQKTISSTEQNAGKGDNTVGIHSTAYLLNLISSSFDQIYTQIGGNDNAGLRKKIKDVQTAIRQITDSTPGQLTELRENIRKINEELANPGAAGTMKSILDTLEGFNKDTDKVKDYIDKQDQTILGSTADAATAYTVYGVRKYVDTTAQTNLIGKSGDTWPNQKTLYGVVKYSDTKNGNLKTTLIGKAGDTIIDTHYGLKHILIGNTADTTINTHWGVKNSLIGSTADAATANTIWGAKKYADDAATTAKNEAISAAASDAAAKANTALSNAKAYADTKKSEAINAAASDAAAKANTAKNDAIKAAASDATTKVNTALSNAKAYADTKKSEAINAVQGTDDDDLSKDTIWGAKKYADDAATTAKNDAIKAAASDATTKVNTALSNAKAYADTKKSEAINAAASDATTKANTALSNAKAYADTKKSEAINAAASDATTKANTALSNANNYTNTKISEIARAAFKVSRIEEGNEGILVFSTVSSYAG